MQTERHMRIVPPQKLWEDPSFSLAALQPCARVLATERTAYLSSTTDISECTTLEDVENLLRLLSQRPDVLADRSPLEPSCDESKLDKFVSRKSMRLLVKHVM